MQDLAWIGGSKPRCSSPTYYVRSVIWYAPASSADLLVQLATMCLGAIILVDNAGRDKNTRRAARGAFSPPFCVGGAG